jgi:hypothetical protein
MSDFKHQTSRISPHEALVPGDDASRPDGSGRAAFDHRGDAVWEWHTETGNFSRSVSTTRVQKLEAPELSIEKTFIAQKPDITPQEEDPASAARGYNPYDRARLQPEKAVASRPVTPVPPTKPAIAAATRKDAGALTRLRNWFGNK